jgi:hypothetical protein
MKICFFCCEREIPYCKYNHTRQNCCGMDECLEKRRKGYQATVRDEEYHKQPEVRERANRQRRARRRAAAYPLMPCILRKCSDKVKRIIEPLSGGADIVLQTIIAKVVAVIRNALDLAL